MTICPICIIIFEIDNDYHFQFHSEGNNGKITPYYIVIPKTLKIGTISADRNCDITNKADIKDCLGGLFS